MKNDDWGGQCSCIEVSLIQVRDNITGIFKMKTIDRLKQQKLTGWKYNYSGQHNLLLKGVC